ncbi:MAG: hypothetical protein V1904_13075 [Bacteroidota bacterium]
MKTKILLLLLAFCGTMSATTNAQITFQTSWGNKGDKNKDEKTDKKTSDNNTKTKTFPNFGADKSRIK